MGIRTASIDRCGSRNRFLAGRAPETGLSVIHGKSKAPGAAWTRSYVIAMDYLAWRERFGGLARRSSPSRFVPPRNRRALLTAPARRRERAMRGKGFHLR